jgi:alpha-galactosidase
MKPETRDILINKEAIAIDQDSMGIQGRRVHKDGDLEVWSKQLADGGRAVALLNRGASEQTVAANWRDLGYPETLKASVRDLWEHKDLSSATGSFSASVPSHGVVLVRIKP